MRKAATNLEALPELAARWCQELGLNVTAKFEASGDEELFPNRLVLLGSDAQWLLPNKGQALDALQFLLHEAQGEREDGKLVYLYVQAFRLFSMTELKAMAAMAAKKTLIIESGNYKITAPLKIFNFSGGVWGFVSCTIKGERSVIGMNVKVNSWSYLEECVILGGPKSINTEIGRWCNLRRVIMDRDVVIPEGTIIGHDKNNDEQRGFKVVEMDDGKHLHHPGPGAKRC